MRRAFLMRVTRRYRNPLLRRMPVPSAAHRLAVSGNALWRKSADTPDFEIAKHFHTLVVPTPLSRPRFAAVPSVARTVPPSAPFTLPNFFLSFTFFFFGFRTYACTHRRHCRRRRRLKSRALLLAKCLTRSQKTRVDADEKCVANTLLAA